MSLNAIGKEEPAIALEICAIAFLPQPRKTMSEEAKSIWFHALTVQTDQIYRRLNQRDRFALSQYLLALGARVNVEAQAESPSLFKPYRQDDETIKPV